MKILGVDYGEKRIGLSLSEGKFARPIGIEANDKNFAEKIRNLCQKEEVREIVVGVSEGKMAQKQKEFGASLGQITGCKVSFWDETLTTHEALRKMIESGKRKMRRRQNDDIAAAEILQSFLDNRKIEV